MMLLGFYETPRGGRKVCWRRGAGPARMLPGYLAGLVVCYFSTSLHFGRGWLGVWGRKAGFTTPPFDFAQGSGPNDNVSCR